MTREGGMHQGVAVAAVVVAVLALVAAAAFVALRRR